LIHAGFILLSVAFLWGNISGFRSGPHRVFQGEHLAIPNMPGFSLLLEEFTPRLEPSGRPLDMLNQVSLWEDGTQVSEALVRMNHPLIYNGLVVLPTSFGQELDGFKFHVPNHGLVELRVGSRLSFSPDASIVLRKLLPDARRNNQGRVVQSGNRLNNPAMLISLQGKTGTLWEGWYFLRSPLPRQLSGAGIVLRPTEPLFRTYSLLTINRDPGDKTAALGAGCITLGVFFALFSFYHKRARGERPEV
jgi:cytochrome c biogenesis protein